MGYTLSLIPDPNDPCTKLYAGQRLLLTVVATATGGDTISAGAQVQLDNLGSGLQFDTRDTQTDYSGRRTVVLSDNNTVGKATFILDVLDGTPTTNATNLGLRVSSFGLPFRPTTFNYTTLAPRLSAQLTGPSQAYVPVPPAGSDVPLLPTEVVYTTIFTATLTDGEDTPVANCVIDWHELATGAYTNLFLTQMYTYLRITDTAPLTQDDSDNVGADSDGQYFIRTVTDSSGYVSLYLVANRQNIANGLAAGGLNVWSYFDQSTPTGQFVVADLSALPTPGCNASPIPYGIEDGKVNYPSIDGARVPVNINLLNCDINTYDPIYLFINGSLAQATAWDPTKATDYYTSFAKIDAYSDSGYHANDSNTLQFVWVNTSNATINLGNTTSFQGTGDRGATRSINIYPVLDHAAGDGTSQNRALIAVMAGDAVETSYSRFVVFSITPGTTGTPKFVDHDPGKPQQKTVLVTDGFADASFVEKVAQVFDFSISTTATLYDDSARNVSYGFTFGASLYESLGWREPSYSEKTNVPLTASWHFNDAPQDYTYEINFGLPATSSASFAQQQSDSLITVVNAKFCRTNRAANYNPVWFPIVVIDPVAEHDIELTLSMPHLAASPKTARLAFGQAQTRTINIYPVLNHANGNGTCQNRALVAIMKGDEVETSYSGSVIFTIIQGGATFVGSDSGKPQQKTVHVTSGFADASFVDTVSGSPHDNVIVSAALSDNWAPSVQLDFSFSGVPWAFFSGMKWQEPSYSSGKNEPLTAYWQLYNDGDAGNTYDIYLGLPAANSARFADAGQQSDSSITVVNAKFCKANHGAGSDFFPVVVIDTIAETGIELTLSTPSLPVYPATTQLSFNGSNATDVVTNKR